MQKRQKNFLSISALLCSSLFFSSTLADSFDLKINGNEIENISAIELKLAFEPDKSYFLNQDLKIFAEYPDLVSNGTNLEPRLLSSEILYKYVDPSSSHIRIFFEKPIRSKEIIISGELERSNYTGDIAVTIPKKNFISDFSKKIDSSKISTEISIEESKDTLPFMGISKAEILGPKTRIQSGELVVAVGNIETYGFSLGKSIDSIKINGQEAKVINNEIIVSNIKLDDSKEELEINLEIDVDKKIIQKKLGTITLIEAI